MKVFVILLLCAAVFAKPNKKEFKLLELLEKVVNKETRAATCGVSSAVTSSEADDFVAQHNFFRSEEPASNMKRMRYSDELAARSQEWANQCHWEHDMTTDCSGDGIGQNLALSYGGNSVPTTYSIDSAMTGWVVNEKPDYDYDNNYCQPGKMCGHYTQVVWANSDEVGCGVAYCPTMTTDERDMYGQKTGNIVHFVNNGAYVVCDYRPAGNYNGVRPYLEGTACSECGSLKWDSGYKCESDFCVACDIETDSNCQCPLTSCSGLEDVWQSYGCDQNIAFCEDPMYTAFMYSKCERSCTCQRLDALPARCNTGKREVTQVKKSADDNVVSIVL